MGSFSARMFNFYRARVKPSYGQCSSGKQRVKVNHQPEVSRFQLGRTQSHQLGRTQPASHSQDLSLWGVCHLWLLSLLILFVCLFLSVCLWLNVFHQRFLGLNLCESYWTLQARACCLVSFNSRIRPIPSRDQPISNSLTIFSDSALQVLSVSLNISFPSFCLFPSFPLSIKTDRPITEKQTYMEIDRLPLALSVSSISSHPSLLLHSSGFFLPSSSQSSGYLQTGHRWGIPSTLHYCSLFNLIISTALIFRSPAEIPSHCMIAMS